MGLVAVAVLAVVVVLSAVQRELRVSVGSPPRDLPAAAPRDSATAPVPEAPALAAAEPSREPAAPAPAEPVDSTPPRDSIPAPEPTEPTPISPPVETPPPAPPAPSEDAEIRYASTWVNVRAERSGNAPVVTILDPGDSIVVDSLRQGWYRAMAGGQTLGYVHRAFVGSTPEPSSP